MRQFEKEIRLASEFNVKPTSERATNINKPAVIDEYGKPVEFDVREAAINVKFRPYTFNGIC